MAYRTPHHRRQQEKKQPKSALSTVLCSDKGRWVTEQQCWQSVSANICCGSLPVRSNRSQDSQDPETPANRVPASEKDCVKITRGQCIIYFKRLKIKKSLAWRFCYPFLFFFFWNVFQCFTKPGVRNSP